MFFVPSSHFKTLIPGLPGNEGQDDETDLLRYLCFPFCVCSADTDQALSIECQAVERQTTEHFIFYWILNDVNQFIPWRHDKKTSFLIVIIISNFYFDRKMVWVVNRNEEISLITDLLFGNKLTWVWIESILLKLFFIFLRHRSTVKGWRLLGVDHRDICHRKKFVNNMITEIKLTDTEIHHER